MLEMYKSAVFMRFTTYIKYCPLVFNSLILHVGHICNVLPRLRLVQQPFVSIYRSCG